MTFNFLDFTSKTVWLGLAMLIAGLLKSSGVDVPLLTSIITSFYPGMDGGALISGGFALMFMREGISKAGR